MKKICSPVAERECKKRKKCKTCFNKTSLLKIARAYNKTVGEGKRVKTTNRTLEQLWDDLRNVFSTKCKDDSCWLKQKLKMPSAVLNDMDHQTFRPEMPDEMKKNRNEWLSNFDIGKVLYQYADYHSDFVFFGPVPVDCPNGIMCELSNMNPVHIKKDKITKIGIVFNLDKHNQPGSHWVAMFIDMTHPLHYIDYFDSAGDEPPGLIKKFMYSIKTKFDKNKDQSALIYNNRRHQFGKSECGVFSIYYILSRIEGKTPHQLSKKHIKDSHMNRLRDYYFRR
tara:strand:- start:2480 stop:3322 length:843 start_codon:yes stop_codon:yes gene_type:complete